MGYGGRALFNLKRGGYEGVLYPVNPNYDVVQGLPAYPTVSAIPDPVDLAMIVVPSHLVIEVVEDCGKKGVPAALIVSAGFAEEGADGRDRQERVVTAARRCGVRIVGPNCLGIANIPGRVFAAATSAATWTRDAHVMIDGPISIVSQSGALAFSPILARSQERGVGLRYLISVGNQGDLTLTDFVEYLVEEDRSTEVIAVFMEGLPPGEGARFLEVCRRAVEIAKPILVLKVARTSESAAVARSHTAVLTGDDAVYEGAFRQGGVARVGDLDELWETGNLFAAVPELPSDTGIAFVSPSGGMNSLFTDLCSMEGVPMASLGPGTVAGIGELLEGRGHAGNPTDATGQLTRPSFQEILRLLEEDPSVGLIVIGLTQLASGERSQETAHHIVEAFGRASIPYVVMWASATTLDGVPNESTAGISKVQAAGIPVFDAPGKAARALGLLRRTTERRAVAMSEIETNATAKIPRFELGTMGPAATFGALSRAGIEVAAPEVAGSVENAQKIAERIGFPVVLKIDAPGLLHKTDVDGVRLHVSDPASLVTAYRDLWDTTESLGEDRAILVQEEVTGGAEFLIGGVRDPIFGSVITLGSGGTWAEIAGDTSTRVAPVGPSMARSMVNELKSARILSGLRGGPSYDVGSLVDAVVRFSRLFAGLDRGIAEMEVNPLLVLPEGGGVKVVDAVAVPAPDA